MRGGGCMKIPNRTNGVDIPHVDQAISEITAQSQVRPRR